MRDAGASVDAAPTDAPMASDGGAWDAAVAADVGVTEGIAPADTVAGEIPHDDGGVPVTARADEDAVVRVDVAPGEHVTFFLSFARADADVELEVLRWDGASAVHVGTTDAGPGLRTLAVVEPAGPRTFWARTSVLDGLALDATLTVTRVPYEDGATCAADCAHLLQLPLPIDSVAEGYRVTSGTVFRYQYGRRDLLMFIRHAGRRMAGLGMAPFVPEDLSQWDGETPGIDVGSPRHASHQRGKDVDISLYGLDGDASWRSFCTTMNGGSGRECVPGTVSGYDARVNALLFGDFFATGRVTMCFLDAELIAETIPGAMDEVASGRLSPDLLPLYSDDVHLQHWPNHDNHIHVRVSEDPATMFGWAPSASPPFEPP